MYNCRSFKNRTIWHYYEAFWYFNYCIVFFTTIIWAKHNRLFLRFGRKQNTQGYYICKYIIDEHGIRL